VTPLGTARKIRTLLGGAGLRTEKIRHVGTKNDITFGVTDPEPVGGEWGKLHMTLAVVRVYERGDDVVVEVTGNNNVYLDKDPRVAAMIATVRDMLRL
jgi:hypothetical protein